MSLQTIEVGGSGKNYQLTSLATVQQVPGLPMGSGPGGRVMIQALTQNVRYTVDGVDPTTTTGMRLQATETHSFNVAPDTVIKVIEEAASAQVNVIVFK